MLTVLDRLPEGLLERDARSLHAALPGPTLLHLAGRRPQPLFVSALLHGNEPVGWEALREVLGRYQGAGLPRSLSILLGNVAAAREGLRRLDGQPDYNRVWCEGDGPEHAMAAQVVDEMRRRSVFASVDLHNNTGRNPHYACVNHLESAYLHLATLFSRTVVYFTRPACVQSMAFGRLCPAVTLECGQPGERHGVEHARDYLEACLHLADLPSHTVPEHDLQLFHTVATVKVLPEVSLGFTEGEADLRLAPDLDRLNFQELAEGTTFGQVADTRRLGLVVLDEHGRDVAARYFVLDGGEVRTRIPVMPSMLTIDERIVRQDCLCYLMERYRAPGG
jgi:succinylglutamate desuccinylase